MNSSDSNSSSVPIIPKTSESIRRTTLENLPTYQPNRKHLVGRFTIKILSTVLIPLCIGVFTIVSTLQQTRIADETRLKDLHIANETRNAEKIIADSQRQQELHVAEQNRAKDRDLAGEGQRETVLNEYIRNIADLLLINNYSLSTAMKEHIIRPKTLTALRQLDIHRKGLLILFLYESKLLMREDNPIKMIGADLNSMVFPQRLGPRLRFDKLSLVGALLHNASFRNYDIYEADFTLADMVAADFSQSIIGSSDFDQANLAYSNFNGADLFACNFRRANLTETRFVTDSTLIIKQFSLSQAIINKTHLASQHNHMAMLNDCDLPGMWKVRGVVLRRYGEYNEHDWQNLIPESFRQGSCYFHSEHSPSYINYTLSSLDRNQTRFIQFFPTVIEVLINSIYVSDTMNGPASPLFVRFKFYDFKLALILQVDKELFQINYGVNPRAVASIIMVQMFARVEVELHIRQNRARFDNIFVTIERKSVV